MSFDRRGRGLPAGADRQSATFNFTPYLVTALIFLLITIPLARLTDWLVGTRPAPALAGAAGAWRRDGDGPRARRRRPRVEGLHKSFGELEVLRGIDLSVREHEVVVPDRGVGERQVDAPAVRQPASSRSTRAGSASRATRSPGRASTLDRIRRRIGIVFQAYNLFPHMTVARQRDARAAEGAPPDARRPPRRSALRTLSALWPGREGARLPGPRCRAASSSGSRSCGRSRCRPTSCCSTRSRAPSTRSSSPRSST